MSNLARKMARQNKAHRPADIKVPPQRVAMNYNEWREASDRIMAEAVRRSIMKVFILTMYLLWEHWGELSKKGTRLKVFHKMFKEALGALKDSEDIFQNMADAFHQQTGMSIQEDIEDLCRAAEPGEENGAGR